MPPQLWIIAGPNGAGKSTLVRTGAIPLLAGCTHVNPDEIAVELGGAGRLASVVLAGREAVHRFDALLEERRDIAVETTLSGETYFRRLPRARELGYTVNLAYVWIGGVEITIDRIRLRVRSGGHDDPAADAMRRFDRSFANARRLMELADNWLLFENSGDRSRAVARLEEGRFEIFEPALLKAFMSIGLGDGTGAETVQS